MRPTLRLARPLIPLLGSAAFLLGCQDGSDPSAVVGPRGGPSPYVTPPTHFDDIDQGDTHFSMQATAYNSSSVTLEEPVYDAATGQLTHTLTFAAPAEELYIESGYDAYDRVRLNHFRGNDGTDPEVGITEGSYTLKATGSSFTQYDASGQPIPVEIPPDAVSFSPLTEIGSLENVSITSGVIIDEASTDPNAPRPTSVASAEDPLRRENGAHRVDRGENLLVVTTFFPEGSSGEAASISAQGAGGEDGGHGKMVRTFRKHGNKYVLEEVDVTAETRTPEARFQTRQTLRVRKVKWYENKDEDGKRKAKREGSGARVPEAPGAFAARTPVTTTVISPPERCPEDSYECNPPPDPEPVPTTPGQNIVFQHGIFSGPDTWDRMDPWLSSEFRFGTKRKPDTGSQSGLSVQAGRLKADVDATGQSSFLFVGHSQGGLISRDVAQRYGAEGRLDMVKGVVTIGTPHQGANLARNGKSAIDRAFRSHAGRLFGSCVSKYMSVSCWIGDQIIGQVIPVITQYTLDQTVPASSDLRPGSPYTAQLNAGYEPFQRVGIQSYSNKRFVWMRLMADYMNNPEDAFGGRNVARYTQWAYDGLWACGVVSIFVLRPNWAAFCISRARALDDTDRFWDRLTAPGDRSDGIVQGTSQVYPAATRQYPISKGDSHVGENKSDKTKGSLSLAFREMFGVPTY